MKIGYVNATSGECSWFLYYSSDSAWDYNPELGNFGNRGGGVGSTVGHFEANIDFADATGKLPNPGAIHLCN